MVLTMNALNYFSKNIGVLITLLSISFFGWAQPTTVTYNFTGGTQSWTVPDCVTSITVTVAGAQGGGIGNGGGNNAFGGNGAVVTASINVTPGQVIDMVVGSAGTVPNAGWPGGGSGWAGTGGSAGSGGGGGSSTLLIAGAPFIIASGGGGAGGGNPSAAGGGGGGCATGTAGAGSIYTGTGGVGGSQMNGGAGGPPWGGGQFGQAGSAGQGGNGGFYGAASGGGGGGGLYGGGGGGSDNCCAFANGAAGGGGGSSLIPAGAGCNGSGNSGNGYVSITYTGGLAATAANTGPYCEGETIQLNGPGGVSTYIYSWTGPNGFTSNVQNPTIPNATLAMDGTYQLILTDSTCPDADTATTVVVVNPVPTVDPVTDQIVCHGDNTQAVNFSGNLPGAIYSWTNDNTTTGLAANGNGTIAAFTGNAIGVVEVSNIIVTPSTPFCTGTPEQFSITVLPTPTVNVSNDTIICENGTGTLLAEGQGGGGGPYTYYWDFTANNDSNQYVNPSVATSYSVYVDNVYGCVSAPATIDVTMHPPFAGAISPFDTICPGYPTDIFANVAGGIGAPYTFTWSSGDTQTGAASHTVEVNPPVTTQYTVTITDQCETTPLVMQTEVYVAPLPVPQYEVLDPEQCEPAVFHIVNTTDPALSQYNYWFVEPNMEYINQDTITTDTLMAGSYDMQMIITSYLGCVDSLYFDDALTVRPKPIAKFLHNPNPVLMFNTDVYFTNYSVNGYTYEWWFEQGMPATSTQTNVNVSFPDGVTGSYEIELVTTSELGCTDTMIYDLAVFPEVLIYAPNTFTPDGDEFNQSWQVYMEGIDVYDFELLIFNRWGEIIWESHDISVPWNGTYNGKIVPSDTYTWILRASDMLNDGKYEYSGHINLLR